MRSEHRLIVRLHAWLAAATAPLIAIAMGAIVIGAIALGATPAGADDRPNILWILSEDMGLEMGCYDYPAAETPNLDHLAKQGVRFTSAFGVAPVCSVNRSSMITGMYATSIGAQNHRSHRGDGFTLAPPVKVITDYFRAAGYFTCNVKTPAPGLKVGGKTDFNFKAGKVFDGSDWSQRKPGQPFYAQINFSEPHRGKPYDPWSHTRRLKDKTDPADVVLPPFYPDLPVVRQDWAGYLDAIRILDGKVGQVLKRLDDEGLADNTVVFFFGDNGRCQARGKQFLYDGGMRVPLLVRWPGKLDAGAVDDRLVCSIDFAATSLALAGIAVPDYMQGRVFLGPKESPPRQYVFGIRDRCDETVDRIRAVRDHRYKYIRNFMPDRPYMAPNAYKEASYPVWNLLKELSVAGKLTPAQALFVAPRRPAEELYDLAADPDEIHNLARSPQHADVLKRMRGVLDQWIKDTADQGAVPEDPAVIAAVQKQMDAAARRWKKAAGIADK